MKVAVIQLGALGISTDKLSAYLRACTKEQVSLVLLGEYVLNRFFKELIHMPKSMIQEQSKKHILDLKLMAKTYDVTIVAPLVVVKGHKVFKTIMRFTPTRSYTYIQQLLINYKHWNEEAYFDNPIEPLQAPMTFKHGKFKLAVMGGYELHFDSMFQELDSLGVECLLLPTMSTFSSHERWKNLITMRAFTHQMYIIRANRIGEYQDEDIAWEFYGDSIAVSPEGEVLEHLGNTEEILIIDLEKQALKEAKSWGFKEAIKKR